MPVSESVKPGELTAEDMPGYRPAGTNGIGLPNYQAGWFRLKNQRQSTVFVTDWSRSVIVPTRRATRCWPAPKILRLPRCSASKRPWIRAEPAARSPRRKPSPSRPRARRHVARSRVRSPRCSSPACWGPVGLRPGPRGAVRFEVPGEGLRIRGPYGRLVPRDALMVREARLVDLKTDPSLPRS